MSSIKKWCEAILQVDTDKMSITSVRNIQLIKQEFERMREIERNAEMINEINNSLNQEVQKWKDKHYTAMQKIVELEKDNEWLKKADFPTLEYIHKLEEGLKEIAYNFPEWNPTEQKYDCQIKAKQLLK